MCQGVYGQCKGQRIVENPVVSVRTTSGLAWTGSLDFGVADAYTARIVDKGGRSRSSLGLYDLVCVTVYRRGWDIRTVTISGPQLRDEVASICLLNNRGSARIGSDAWAQEACSHCSVEIWGY